MNVNPVSFCAVTKGAARNAIGQATINRYIDCEPYDKAVMLNEVEKLVKHASKNELYDVVPWGSNLFAVKHRSSGALGKKIGATGHNPRAYDDLRAAVAAADISAGMEPEVVYDKSINLDKIEQKIIDLAA